MSKAAKPKTVKPKVAKAAKIGAPETASVPPRGSEIMERLWATVLDRRSANPNESHSARLLSRGTAKVAQKFGEEAVECLIEAVANNPAALVSESADVLYHLVVLWVSSGVEPGLVWAELERREGISGVAEKAARFQNDTKKIP